MKGLARLLSIILIVAMLFSFAACDSGSTGGGNSDGGENGGNSAGDGSNSGNGENNGGNGEAKPNYTQMANDYVSGAIAQLEAAKSMEMTVSFSSLTELEANGEKLEENVTDTEMKVKVSYDGATPSFFLSSLSESRYSSDGMEYVFYSVEEMIVKGEVTYSRGYEYDGEATDKDISALAASTLWIKEKPGDDINVSFDISAIEDFIAELKELDELGAKKEEIIKEAEAHIAEQLEKNGIQDGKFSWTEDYTEDFASVIDFIKDIDPEKDSIEAVIDRILQEQDPEMNFDKLCAQIVLYSKMEVAELVGHIEKMLADEHGTTLQEVIDSIVTSEAFESFAAATEMPNDVYNTVKNLKVSEIVAEFGEVSLDQLIYQMTSEPNEDGSPAVLPAGVYYVEMLLAKLREDYLSKPISELGEDGEGITGSLISENLELIGVTSSADVQFDEESGALKNMEFAFKLSSSDGVYDLDGALLGNSATTAKITVKIDKISDKTVTISAPAKNMIFDGIIGEHYFISENGLELFVYADLDGGYLELSQYDEDSGEPLFTVYAYTDKPIKYNTGMKLAFEYYYDDTLLTSTEIEAIEAVLSSDESGSVTVYEDGTFKSDCPNLDEMVQMYMEAIG